MAPVLAYADFSLPFILDVDASYGGLGVVLSPEQGGVQCTGKIFTSASLPLPLESLCLIFFCLFLLFSFWEYS